MDAGGRAACCDRVWPDSLISITTIVNDQGEIVAKHRKARNIKGAFFGFELFTTTIYDVMDRYVDMYGADIAATSMYNQLYAAIANNAASPGNGRYFEDPDPRLPRPAPSADRAHRSRDADV